MLRRLWSRVAFAWRWLCRPDEVGKPLSLRPRGVRLLILLILGNLAVLVLLTVALYQVITQSSIEEPPEFVVVATATPGPSPTPSPTPTPFGSGGAIAFTLRRNGNADIYALNQAERQLVRLTYDPDEDRDPAWSPDGNYVAFASNHAHNWDIYLLDLVSGALIRLTHDPGFDANPSWSPDGRWIAFESYRHGNLDVYVMSTTDQQLRRITTERAPDYGPAWSPDSRAIAFSSFRDGNKDIYLYLLDDGGEIINITQSPDLDEDDPAWSPDGTQLAYASGPRGHPSIQVTTFDWDALVVNQTQTELLGAGSSPAWAPDGQSLVYTYERGGRSHLVAASMTGWALFQDVYSIEGPLDDLAWTSLALSPRVVARAQAAAPPEGPPFYVELVQPTPVSGPPYRLFHLPNVSGDREPFLSNRVNESFNALRQRVVDETGWDYLATLGSSWLPITHTPPSGHSRMSWHVCGRAIGLDQESYEGDEPSVELIREDVGNVTYWRVFIRAAEQDGSMGEPLREAVWDLNARQEGGRAMVEGGAPKAYIPAGYYVDFTTLASDYGWERVPALWRWRYFWPDIRWWEFQKTDGLTWWECMLEVFEPRKIEAAFGPIPGYED
ncbi:MAG: DPP IV N-terminal domain-containing protein [Chloroflexota bacterium]|nr:DPP IV N-terminal domain-containing protein [Chloroflexota bacterium]